MEERASAGLYHCGSCGGPGGGHRSSLAPGWEDGNEPAVSPENGAPAAWTRTLIPSCPVMVGPWLAASFRDSGHCCPSPGFGCHLAGLFCFFGSVHTRPLPVYLTVDSCLTHLHPPLQALSGRCGLKRPRDEPVPGDSQGANLGRGVGLTGREHKPRISLDMPRAYLESSESQMSGRVSGLHEGPQSGMGSTRPA